MPEDRPAAIRSTLVKLFWCLIFVVLFGAVISLAVGISQWGSLVEVSNAWGNVASVIGLWLGLIAFLVTILTLLLTHQVEKDARGRIEQTVTDAAVTIKNAQEQARGELHEAVGRIGFELLQSECRALDHAIRETHRLAMEAAGRGEYWVRVAERCREAAHAAILLCTFIRKK